MNRKLLLIITILMVSAVFVASQAFGGSSDNQLNAGISSDRSSVSFSKSADSDQSGNLSSDENSSISDKQQSNASSSRGYYGSDYYQGRDSGFKEGRDYGYDQGRNQGFSEGRSQGYNEGRDYGYAEGYRSGYSEGYGHGRSEGQNSYGSYDRQGSQNSYGNYGSQGYGTQDRSRWYQGYPTGNNSSEQWPGHERGYYDELGQKFRGAPEGYYESRREDYSERPGYRSQWYQGFGASQRSEDSAGTFPGRQRGYYDELGQKFHGTPENYSRSRSGTDYGQSRNGQGQYGQGFSYDSDTPSLRQEYQGFNRGSAGSNRGYYENNSDYYGNDNNRGDYQQSYPGGYRSRGGDSYMNSGSNNNRNE